MEPKVSLSPFHFVITSSPTRKGYTPSTSEDSIPDGLLKYREYTFVNPSFSLLEKTTTTHDFNQYQSALRTLILDLIGEVPRQIYDLAPNLKDKVSSPTIRLCFTEEIKDGRSPRFSTNRPLALKGKKLELNGITIAIKDIKFSNQESQESDSSSEYIEYYFDTTLEITYP